MSDYTEHLISMAGGDGDRLAEIEARRADCQTYNFGMRNADKLAHEDVPYLLAMVREQRAAIERVEALHQQRGGSYKTCSHCVRPSGYPNRSEQPVAWPCPTIAALTTTDKP
jgi:hypothetical protein